MTDPTVTDPAVPPRRHGIAHLFAASRYSWQGLARLWRETAFRHEAAMGGGLIAALLLADAALTEWLAMSVLFLLLIAMEALNTAIETLADHVSPGWSAAAGQAKDLGSLAVFCTLIANGLGLLVILL